MSEGSVFFRVDEERAGPVPRSYDVEVRSRVRNTKMPKCNSPMLEDYHKVSDLALLSTEVWSSPSFTGMFTETASLAHWIPENRKVVQAAGGVTSIDEALKFASAAWLAKVGVTLEMRSAVAHAR